MSKRIPKSVKTVNQLLDIMADNPVATELLKVFLANRDEMFLACLVWQDTSGTMHVVHEPSYSPPTSLGMLEIGKQLIIDSIRKSTSSPDWED